MSDKIIRFPGGGAKPGAPKDAAEAKPGKGAGAKKDKVGGSPVDPAALSEEQRKAMGIVLSGMPFVVIGIKPTTSGADFFTAVGGDAADLRNAQPHLDGVIDRALTKHGG